MLTPPVSLFTWLRSLVAGQLVLESLGLLLTVSGYFLWQVVGAFIHFFAFGSGERHRDQGLMVAASCALLHLGILSGLVWCRVLYSSGWAWVLNTGVVVSLFVQYVFQPWQGSSPDSTYQRYSFARGTSATKSRSSAPAMGLLCRMSPITKMAARPRF